MKCDHSPHSKHWFTTSFLPLEEGAGKQCSECDHSPPSEHRFPAPSNQCLEVDHSQVLRASGATSEPIKPWPCRRRAMDQAEESQPRRRCGQACGLLAWSAQVAVNNLAALIPATVALSRAVDSNSSALLPGVDGGERTGRGV